METVPPFVVVEHLDVIDDYRQLEPAFMRAYVRDICHSGLIGFGRAITLLSHLPDGFDLRAGKETEQTSRGSRPRFDDLELRRTRSSGPQCRRCCQRPRMSRHHHLTLG